MQLNTGSSHGDLVSCSLNLWGAAHAAAATSSYCYTAEALDDDDDDDELVRDDDDDDDVDDHGGADLQEDGDEHDDDDDDDEAAAAAADEEEESSSPISSTPDQFPDLRRHPDQKQQQKKKKKELQLFLGNSRVRSSNPSCAPAASCIDADKDDDQSNDHGTLCSINVDSYTHHKSPAAAAMISVDHRVTTTFGANMIDHHHHHHHHHPHHHPHHHQIQKKNAAAMNAAMAAPNKKKMMICNKKKQKLKKDHQIMINVINGAASNNTKIKRAPQRGLGVAQLEKLRRLMDSTINSSSSSCSSSSNSSSSSTVTTLRVDAAECRPHIPASANPNPNPASANPNPNPALQINPPRYVNQSTRSIFLPAMYINDMTTMNPSACSPIINQHANRSDDPHHLMIASKPILAANRHHNPECITAAAITTAISSSAGCGISPSLLKYDPIPNLNPDHQHQYHRPSASNSNYYNSSSGSTPALMLSSGTSNRIHNAFDFVVSAPDHQIQIAADKKKPILQAISHSDYVSELACSDHILRQANNYDLLISDLGSYKQQSNIDVIDSSDSHRASIARSTRASQREYISDNATIHEDDLKLSLCNSSLQGRVIEFSIPSLGSPNRSIMNNIARDQAAHNRCNLYANTGQLDLSLKL